MFAPKNRVAKKPLNRQPRAGRLIAIQRWEDVPPEMTESEEDEFCWRTHELGAGLSERSEPLPADVTSLIERARHRRMARVTHPAP